MTSVSLGPLALPLVPLLWLAALWLAQAVAGRWADRRLGTADGAAVRSAFWWAAAGGLLAARIGFVAPAWPAYAAEPWSLLNLRDGGWNSAAGALGAAAVLTVVVARRPAWRWAVSAGWLAGALAWGVAVMVPGPYQQPALPALSLVGADGRSAALPALVAGRPAVVNLWASWCAPCRVEMPVLAAAQAKHPQVHFLFVNQGEADAPIQRYLAAQPFRLDGVWRDPASALGPAIGSSGLPTTLFIDAEGRVVARHFGPLSAGSLAGRLAALGVAPPR